MFMLKLKTKEKTMKIQILSNGSKWADEEPDSIEKLMEVLKQYPLDIERFALYGFVHFPENTNLVRCFGNFLTISHVFRIEGDKNSQEIKNLISAIDANIKRQF